MVLPLYASLERLDARLLEAASDLYAGPGRARSCKVTLPLSMPGVVAGTLLTFIPAAGDYINAELLGTPQTYMIGNVIDSAFLVRLDYPQAAALSFLLMAAILVMVFVYVCAGPARTRWSDDATALWRWVADHWVMASGLLVLAYLFLPIVVVRRAVVQPAVDPAVVRPQRVHPGQLARPVRPGRHVRRGRAQHRDRAAGHGGRHRARHADGVRPGPAPLPRPVRHQPADLPADGHARGGDGLVAAGAVRRRRRAARASGRWSSRTSCSACRSWWSPSRRGCPAWTPGWRRRRWTCTPTSGRPSAGSRCRWCFPGIVAAALLAFSLSFDDFIITNFNSGTHGHVPDVRLGRRAARHPAAGQRDRHRRCSCCRSCWWWRPPCAGAGRCRWADGAP